MHTSIKMVGFVFESCGKCSIDPIPVLIIDFFRILHKSFSLMARMSMRMCTG